MSENESFLGNLNQSLREISAFIVTNSNVPTYNKVMKYVNTSYNQNHVKPNYH